MKIRVVSSKSEIDRLRKDEQMIHLAFRASNADIFKLLQNCPRIKAIQVPSSYRKTLSQAGEIFLKMQGVKVIEGDIWGHRKDLSEYYIVNDEVFTRIQELQNEGLSTDEITEQVSTEMKMSPNLIRYIIWKAS